ncbi:hypothetical protein [Muribacter muris]|uniref:hypothetical protein n=1 Tax=Muribacter muris TaxID=67855 RepID=UPI00138E20E7|nr:hypothetical protein [Muribacter muris]
MSTSTSGEISTIFCKSHRFLFDGLPNAPDFYAILHPFYTFIILGRYNQHCQKIGKTDRL